MRTARSLQKGKRSTRRTRDSVLSPGCTRRGPEGAAETAADPLCAAEVGGAATVPGAMLTGAAELVAVAGGANSMWPTAVGGCTGCEGRYGVESTTVKHEKGLQARSMAHTHRGRRRSRRGRSRWSAWRRGLR
jgi:hypothetical protein